MIIKPEIFVTPDQPTIRFREPIEQVDLEKELPKILHNQGWGCGTYFNVQFINHGRTELLATARFVVSQEKEQLVTNEDNPHSPVSKTVFIRKAELLGAWEFFGELAESMAELNAKDTEVDSPEAGSTSENGLAVTWNIGKEMFQVKDGDKILFETRDKAEAHVLAGTKEEKVA